MDPNAETLTLGIDDEPVDIYSIGVDVCRNLPLPQIIPAKLYPLCEAITADIFHSVGMQKDEAPACFDAIARRISTIGLLKQSKLQWLACEEFLQKNISKVVRVQAKTGKIVCAPAHVMGCVVAAIAYRKLEPADDGLSQNDKDLVKVFGELNGIQWLSVAIQVFDEANARAFVVELDETRQSPVVETRHLKCGPFWVVTTKMPDMNRYENILRKVLCPDSPSVQNSGPAIPKLEPDDNALPSVEPNDICNEAITLSDNDETEDNTITLRDYSRQMKTLAKRLTTPDRAIAKRARREILKKPDEVGEQEVDEVGPPKEFFDSYTHLKDVWKTCLQNQVSIPNSLRVLVDHHCTPSQVFHLTELEKEYIDEMEMEVDG